MGSNHLVLDKRRTFNKRMHFKRSKVVPHEPLEKLSFAYSKSELPISFEAVSFSHLIVNRLLLVLAAGAAAGVDAGLFAGTIVLLWT